MEIDTEICNFLIDNATFDADIVFNVTPRTGVSLSQQYEGFLATIDTAAEKMFTKTQKYQPNYMLCARSIVTVLGFLPGFKAASRPANSAGPYFAGTLNNDIKVYVHPAMVRDTFVLGLMDGDFNTAAAVYAPFIAIVPTDLIQFPDGTTEKGWATMYDLKLLNKELLIAGKITRNPDVLYISTTE